MEAISGVLHAGVVDGGAQVWRGAQAVRRAFDLEVARLAARRCSETIRLWRYSFNARGSHKEIDGMYVTSISPANITI